MGMMLITNLNYDSIENDSTIASHTPPRWRSSKGNIYRVTGPLWGESTGHQLRHQTVHVQWGMGASVGLGFALNILRPTRVGLIYVSCCGSPHRRPVLRVFCVYWLLVIPWTTSIWSQHHYFSLKKNNGCVNLSPPPPPPPHHYFSLKKTMAVLTYPPPPPPIIFLWKKQWLC